MEIPLAKWPVRMINWGIATVPSTTIQGTAKAKFGLTLQELAVEKHYSQPTLYSPFNTTCPALR